MNLRPPVWISRHLWLKLAALALAIVTWCYIDGELRSNPPPTPAADTFRP